MSRTKITALTQEQKDAIPEWVDKWIKIGLSTEPADRERQEKAIRACYRFAGLKDDVPIVFVSSPIVGALAAPLAALVIEKIKKGRRGTAVVSAVSVAVRLAVDSAVDLSVDLSVDSAVRSAVDSAVYSAVSSAVGSEVDSAVYSAVGSAVGSAVYLAAESVAYSAIESTIYLAVCLEIRSMVDSAVESTVNSAIDSAIHLAANSAVNSAVSSAIKENKKLFWHYWLGGTLWAYWPAFTQFFFEKCGLDLGEMNERASAYAELARSGGYIWPNKDFIIACDRPEKIMQDAQGKLHCEDGMAIRWRDGWGLWMWHGIRVPAKLIMDPEHITKEDVLKETNAEVRRAYAERLGWNKYFSLFD